jgi:hypothetical protein
MMETYLNKTEEEGKENDNNKTKNLNIISSCFSVIILKNYIHHLQIISSFIITKQKYKI